MGSEPDLNIEQKKAGLSRDGSFGSISSASTSTYFTAKEDQNSSLNSSSLYFTAGSGDLKQDPFLRKQEPDSEGNPSDGSVCDSNSATLGGADSLCSSIAALDDEMVSPDVSNLSSSSSDNAIEVREDISRICNAIAESEKLDNSKKKKIETALKLGNLETLSELATSNGGLLSNSLRTRAWPLLLKVSPNEIASNECKKIPNYYPDVPEKISNLVSLDVARVLKRFPPGLTDPQQDHLQLYLSNLICSVLQEKRKAYYYQGFHDISLTFLLASISQSVPYLAYLCLNKMIETNLDPYMEKTMDRTHDVIHVLFAILESEDSSLYKKIVVSSKCPVAFCLPWVLTWYSHTLPNDTDVFRLYDFVLGCQEKLSEPYLIPIFVSASLLLRNSKIIKQDESLTDIASMHHRLSKLPSEVNSLESWLADSLKLIKKYRGQEDRLINKGIEIKALQNRLWNEDNNNQPARRPHPGIISTVSRFFFVKHKWTTVSFVILGAAYFLQTKYKFKALRTFVESYAPETFQNILRNWLVDDANDE